MRTCSDETDRQTDRHEQNARRHCLATLSQSLAWGLAVIRSFIAAGFIMSWRTIGFCTVCRISSGLLSSCHHTHTSLSVTSLSWYMHQRHTHTHIQLSVASFSSSALWHSPCSSDQGTTFDIVWLQFLSQLSAVALTMFQRPRHHTWYCVASIPLPTVRCGTRHVPATKALHLTLCGFNSSPNCPTWHSPCSSDQGTTFDIVWLQFLSQLPAVALVMFQWPRHSFDTVLLQFLSQLSAPPTAAAQNTNHPWGLLFAFQLHCKLVSIYSSFWLFLLSNLLQASRKVMAACRRVYDMRVCRCGPGGRWWQPTTGFMLSPAGWLPRVRDQLRPPTLDIYDYEYLYLFTV